jgi:hypothetical protein
LIAQQTDSKCVECGQPYPKHMLTSSGHCDDCVAILLIDRDYRSRLSGYRRDEDYTSWFAGTDPRTKTVLRVSRATRVPKVGGGTGPPHPLDTRRVTISEMPLPKGLSLPRV